MDQDFQSKLSLFEGDMIQADMKKHRLTLECALSTLTEVLDTWHHIDACESEPYESKVAVQVIMLSHATARLWDLRRTLATARDALKQHQKEL